MSESLALSEPEHCAPAEADAALGSASVSARTAPAVVWRIADQWDLTSVYRMRHDAYVGEGSILPQPSRQLTDEWDEHPQPVTFVLERDQQLLGSIPLTSGVGNNADTPSKPVCERHTTDR